MIWGEPKKQQQQQFQLPRLNQRLNYEVVMMSPNVLKKKKGRIISKTKTTTKATTKLVTSSILSTSKVANISRQLYQEGIDIETLSR